MNSDSHHLSRSSRTAIIIPIAVAIVVVIALLVAFLNRSHMQPSSSSTSSSSSPATKPRQYPPVSGSSHIESITYQTRYQKRTYQKTANVYLPAGYQQNGSRRYDILYLLHGWGGSASDFVGTPGSPSRTSQRIDQLIARGSIPPLIVVASTYYPTGRVSTSTYYDDRPLNLRFARTELPHDLMPAVESRYRTYARSTSVADFQASRAHRAFGGFSMGSITTWFVFQYDLVDFSKFVPMAGDSWTQGSDGGGSDPDGTAAALATAARNQSSRSGFALTDFRIAASVGGADGTQGSTDPQINAMRSRYPQIFTNQTLQYRKDPGGGHDEASAVAQITFDLPWLFR
jgi:enterochelin esterase-like enzyme